MALGEVKKEPVNRGLNMLLLRGSGEGFFLDFSGVKHKDQKWVEYGSNAVTCSVRKTTGKNLVAVLQFATNVSSPPTVRSAT